MTEHGSTVEYARVRRSGGLAYRLLVRPGAPLEPSKQDVWLTFQWRAYTRRLGTLLRTPVEHQPWPLRGAIVEELDQTLTDAAGLGLPVAEPLVHYSDGVCKVRIGTLQPLQSVSKHVSNRSSYGV